MKPHREKLVVTLNRMHRRRGKRVDGPVEAAAREAQELMRLKRIAHNAWYNARYGKNR